MGSKHSKLCLTTIACERLYSSLQLLIQSSVPLLAKVIPVKGVRTGGGADRLSLLLKDSYRTSFQYMSGVETRTTH